MTALCFHGREPDITDTKQAQPAIYLVHWVAFQLLKEREPRLAFNGRADLSLGEFTVLATAGTLAFEAGLRAVRLRGCFMQEACDVTQGGRGGNDRPRRGRDPWEAKVELTNLNCRGRLVISCEADKVARACVLAQAKGAKRPLPLPVAGACQSRLMASARPRPAAAPASVTRGEPNVTVVS